MTFLVLGGDKLHLKQDYVKFFQKAHYGVRNTRESVASLIILNGSLRMIKYGIITRLEVIWRL